MPNSPSPPSGIICSLSNAMDLQFTATPRVPASGPARNPEKTHRLDRPNQLQRKLKHRPDHIKDAADHKPDQPERQQNQPNNRVEHQKDESRRPAQDQEQNKEQQLHAKPP